MPWRRHEFKGQTVYVRVLETGKPIVRRSLVELRYRLGATKSYKSTVENIEALDDEIIPDSEFGGAGSAAAGPKKPSEEPETPVGEKTIIIYTDGACSGNPGPAGVGVYIDRPTDEVELSEFIGSGTNNIAELTGILRALESMSDEEKEASIHLYTDSAWCLGVLIGGWKAKTNLKLIAKIKEQMERLPNLELLKVKGHAGIPGNEEADNLATTAIRRESGFERKRERRKPREL